MLTRVGIVVLHALVIWVLCGATMMIGPLFMSMERTLVVHGIGAPLFAAVVSAFYYRKWSLTTPAQTAAIVTGVIVALDALLVAPIFNQSYEMFSSVLGTWLPFVLIFGATYATGRTLRRR